MTNTNRTAISTSPLLFAAILCIAALTIFAKPAAADVAGTTRLQLNIASYHFDRCYRGCTKKYNEANEGAGLSYSVTDYADFQAGFFENSFNLSSKYAGINLNYDVSTPFGVISPSLWLGGVSGYETITKRDTFGGVMPAAIPTLSLAKGRYQSSFGYIPANFAGKSHVVTFRLGISF